MDTWLHFGCQNCVTFIDKKNLAVTERISPSWRKYQWKAQPVITRDGEFFLKSGAKCISSGRKGLFELLPAEECVALPLDRPSKEDLERVPKSKILGGDGNDHLQYDLYQPRGVPFLVNIWGVACTCAAVGEIGRAGRSALFATKGRSYA